MWVCPKCGEKLEDQFDSCWKCAPKSESKESSGRPLTWSFYVSAAVSAILAPLLADGLHTFFVYQGGIRIYQGAFWWYLVSTMGAGVYVAVRAIITFLVIGFFVRNGFRDRTIWICSAALWLVIDFMLQPLIIAPFLATLV